jgi:hypothetical protein
MQNIRNMSVAVLCVVVLSPFLPVVALMYLIKWLEERRSPEMSEGNSHINAGLKQELQSILTTEPGRVSLARRQRLKFC